MAGAFYLVWWERAERLDDTQVATLEAVGQQVALLLRSAWVLREAERQGAEALAAEQRYRGLVEHVPVGIYRTTPSGKMIDVNSAMVEILRFPDPEALLGINAASLYVNPDDRERGNRQRDAAGVARDFRAQLRTGDGGTVWVRMNARAVRDGDEEYWEGIIEDITGQQRTVSLTVYRAWLNCTVPATSLSTMVSVAALGETRVAPLAFVSWSGMVSFASSSVSVTIGIATVRVVTPAVNVSVVVTAV